MDYQNRAGSKKGSGGVAGGAEANQYRRERLKQLLLSKIDIDSDPYVFKNPQGALECRLCLTLHMSEGSYLTHTKGKKHQMNLLRRAEIEERKKRGDLGRNGADQALNVTKRHWKTIGKPAYKVTKIRDRATYQKGLLFHLEFSKIANEVVPRYRLMSSFEQTVEENADAKYQYLVVSAEPYENVAFKIPSEPLDLGEGRTWDYWDADTKEYFIQLFYREN